MSILIDMNTIEQTEEFEAWLDGLKDRKAQKKIVSEILKMQGGLFSDHKPLGDKVGEAKIDYGPGYRLYYTKTGQTIYLMLGGGTKKRQTEDIKAAKALAKEWFEQQSDDDDDGDAKQERAK